MKLYEKTACALSAMLRRKECSAVELANAIFNRIDEVEDRVGAYITPTRDGALKQAAEVDQKLAAGATLHPLAGIPVAVKDNICTKDVPTTCASKILGNFIPPYDATVVQKLKACGTVMPGKLNMDEFAMGSSCENSSVKPTRNPHDLERVPGGSSGGSAAALAAGETILALGSDTGGSIRQPAACCGVVGLKPTYGTVSRYGLVAFASSLDQIGPMGRSVKDVALLYSVLCGHDPMDATSAPLDYPDFAALPEGSVKGMRIGIPREYFGPGVSSEVRESVMAMAKALEGEGAILHDMSLPSTDYALSAYYIISSAEASSNLARFDGVRYGYRAEGAGSLLELYERSRSEGFGDEVKRRIMLGTFVLSSGFYDAYYKRGKLLQKQIAAEFAAAFESCDLLLTPTAPTTAFKLGENVSDPLKMYASDVCTITVNIAGLPAISLPCGFDGKGLPIGLQLIGPRFSEAALLGAAECVERLGGGCRMPEIGRGM
jgi:aspartyl-tRNA(Asn)/glutamyl-tRNA(Gln) amidotransferase subunit A